MKKYKTYFTFILVMFCSPAFIHLENNTNIINSDFSTDLDIKKRDTGEKIFIENKGQWNSTILFKANLRHASLYIRKEGLSFIQIDDKSFENVGGHYHRKGEAKGVRVDMNFDNSNIKTATVQGKEASSFYHNYIKGVNQTYSAFAYSGIHIYNLYNGIDWRIYTTALGDIKHEFILRPGADPNQIQLHFSGQNGLKVIRERLHIQTGLEPDIIEKSPYTFYIRDGKEIPVSYLVNENIVTFKFNASYDNSKGIIIDPALIFSTFSGSTADNWGFTATFGEDGKAYSGGILYGQGFPSTTGAYSTNFADKIDIGILKYSSDGGQLLYATYLGGNDIDIPHSLLMDKDENLLILGTTSSTDFPVSTNAFQPTLKQGVVDRPFAESVGSVFSRSTDIFLARLSKNGQSLLHSTLIGGTDTDGLNPCLTVQDDAPNTAYQKQLSYNYGDSFRGDLAEGATGDIYVASVTKSDDFPVKNAHQSTYGGGSTDGVLFKIKSDLTDLIWSTYVGGLYGDTLNNMELLENDIIVGGGTLSRNSFLPTTGKYKSTTSAVPANTPAGQHYAEGIVLKVTTAGVITAETYLGTPFYDQVYFVDTDSDGNIFAMGQTLGNYSKSSDTYGNNNGGVFIQKLSSDLSQGLLSSRFGNTIPSFSPTAFLVNTCNDIYITGFANQDLGGRYAIPGMSEAVSIGFSGTTTGLPVTNDAFQSTTDGKDFYLMILSQDAKKLVYGTFFGGVDKAATMNYPGEHLDGGTNRFDENGVIYHAVCAGCGGRSEYPTTSGAYATRNPSNNCNNGFFKFSFYELSANFVVDTPEGGHIGISNDCTPATIKISNITTGSATMYTWDFGDGTSMNTTSKEPVSHTYTQAGNYTISMTAKTDDSCVGASEKTYQFQVVDDPYTIVPSTTICEGETYELFATNVVNPIWTIQGGAIIGRSARLNVSPTTTTTYEFTGATGTVNCNISDTVTITVIPKINVDFNFSVGSNFSGTTICEPLPITVRFSNQSTEFPGMSYIWDFGDGTATSNTLNLDDITHEFTSAGEYQVHLTSTSACNLNNTITKTLRISEDITKENPPELICENTQITLKADDNMTDLRWFENENEIETGQVLTVSPSTNSIYKVVGRTPGGCVYEHLYPINISDVSKVNFRIGANTACASPLEINLESYYDNVEEIIDTSRINVSFFIGDDVYQNTHVRHFFTEEGTYTIKMKVVDLQSNCEIEKTLDVDIPTVYIPNLVTPNGDKKNDTFVVQTQDIVAITIYDRWGREVYRTTDYKNNWPPPGKKYNSTFYYNIQLSRGNACKGWIDVKQ